MRWARSRSSPSSRCVKKRHIASPSLRKKKRRTTTSTVPVRTLTTVVTPEIAPTPNRGVITTSVA